MSLSWFGEWFRICGHLASQGNGDKRWGQELGADDPKTVVVVGWVVGWVHEWLMIKIVG